MSDIEAMGSKALAIRTLEVEPLVTERPITCEGSGSKPRWHCTTPNELLGGVSKYTVHITPTGFTNYVSIGWTDEPSQVLFDFANPADGDDPFADTSLDLTTPAPSAPVIPGGSGYAVTCGDGSISMSGGIQGACSSHGGVS